MLSRSSATLRRALSVALAAGLAVAGLVSVPTAAMAAESLTAAGSVVDDLSLASLPGAEVTLSDSNGDVVGSAVATGDNANWSIAFDGESADTYFLDTSLDGYTETSQFSAAGGVLNGVELHMSADEPATPQYKISGTVTTPGGSAAADVDVSAYYKTAGDDHAAGDYARGATTGDDGTYSIAHLDAGSYYVEFSGDGYKPEVYNNVQGYFDHATAAMTAVTITSADRTAINAEVALQGADSISVTFTGGSVPAPYMIRVQARESDGLWQEQRSRSVETAGTYVLRGLPTATYRVIVEADNGFDGYKSGVLSFTNHAASVDAGALTAEGPHGDGYSISGTISLDEGGTPVGSYAGVFQKEDGAYQDVDVSDYPEDGAPAGAYTISGLNAGDYIVSFYADGHEGQYSGGVSEFTYDDVDPRDTTAIQTVHVGPDSMTGVNASLARNDYSITVKGSSPADTSGFWRADVQRSENGVWLDRDSYYGHSTSLSSGVIEQLTPGTYRVKFSTSGIKEYAPIYRDVTFDSNGHATVTAALVATAQRKVSGVVSFNAGSGVKPIAGVYVTAFKWSTDSSAWQPYAAGALTAAKTGKYSLYLSAGDYMLSYEAQGVAGNPGDVYFNGTHTLPGGPDAPGVTHVVTGTGNTAEITGKNITLPSDEVYNTATLTGTVRTGADTGVVGAKVTISGGDRFFQTVTDASGKWTRAVRPGVEYAVTVIPTTELLGDGVTVTSIDGATTSAPDVVLRAATPLSAAPAVTLGGIIATSPLGVPTVFYGDATPFALSNQCTDGTATVKLTIEGHALNGTLTESPSGSGHYVGEIPAATPYHGDGSVKYTVDCPGAGDATGQFDIYIDPSGTVVDQYGNPVSGAKVTLLAAPTYAGKYVAIPNGSAVMSPANRVNPLTTGASGRFAWDVAAGFYKVQVTYPGAKTVITDGMQVPPARTELVISITKPGAVVPAPLTAPTLSGDDAVGNTLTIDPGTWPSDVTVNTISWKVGTGTKSVGPDHLIVAGEVGKLTAVINLFRSVPGNYAGVEPISYTYYFSYVLGTQKFTKAPTPTITGVPKIGGPLKAVPGTWAPTGATFTYQWSVAGIPVPGATAVTYVPSLADFGKTVTVTATAHKAGWLAKASPASKATAVVGKGDLVAVVPVIAGTLKAGEVIHAVTTDWGPEEAQAELAFQWLRDGKVLAGATGFSYELRGTDTGHVFSVKVTGTPTGPDAAKYTAKALTSKATAKVAAGTVTNFMPPVIFGNPEVGSTLTANPGLWNDDPDSFKFQWFSGTKAIAGATKSTYLVLPADLNKAISVKVTSVKVGYAPTTLATEAVTIGLGHFTEATPVITGSAQVGSTLTATLPGWAPVTGTTFTYKWYRQGTGDLVLITGATRATYKTVTADAGQTISVLVTATRPGFAPSGAHYSDPTDPIANPGAF